MDNFYIIVAVIHGKGIEQASKLRSKTSTTAQTSRERPKQARGRARDRYRGQATARFGRCDLDATAMHDLIDRTNISVLHAIGWTRRGARHRRSRLLPWPRCRRIWSERPMHGHGSLPAPLAVGAGFVRPPASLCARGSWCSLAGSPARSFAFATHYRTGARQPPRPSVRVLSPDYVRVRQQRHCHKLPDKGAVTLPMRLWIWFCNA